MRKSENRTMHDVNHEKPNSNPIIWPIFFLNVAILPISTGLFLIASLFLNWRNRNLPTWIHFPEPIGEVRLQIGNESISWHDAFFIIWLILLCIICIAGAVLSCTKSTTRRRRIATSVALGALAALLVFTFGNQFTLINYSAAVRNLRMRLP